MGDEASRSVPRITPATARSQAERAARLAAAMRANLRRRKAQQRARAASGRTAAPAEPHLSEASTDTGAAGAAAGGVPEEET